MISPTPSKLTQYSFYDAFEKMTQGHKITRLEWANPQIYCQIIDERAKIHNEEGIHDWIVHSTDIENNDWVII